MSLSLYNALLVILILIGLADAAYLSDIAFTGASLVCNIAGLDGCNVVAQSAYSRVFGLPLASYGVVFYGGFLLLYLYNQVRPHRREFLLMALMGLIGAVFSTYFLYVQIFLIKALCVYCVGSAVVSYLLAILTIYRYQKNRKVSLVKVTQVAP